MTVTTFLPVHPPCCAAAACYSGCVALSHTNPSSSRDLGYLDSFCCCLYLATSTRAILTTRDVLHFSTLLFFLVIVSSETWFHLLVSFTHVLRRFKPIVCSCVLEALTGILQLCLAWTSQEIGGGYIPYVKSSWSAWRPRPLASTMS